MRRELIELPLIFSKIKQEYLKNYLKNEIGVDFEFDEKYHSFLIDYELLFMNAVSDVAPSA